LITLLIGLSAFVVSLACLAFGFNALHRAQIYPGVRVGWVDLSGMTMEEAAQALAREITYPTQGQIILRDGNQIWVISPAQAGLLFSAGYNAQRAYNLGRSGTFRQQLSEQFQAWYAGANLAPEMIFDEFTAERTLQMIAAQIDRPTVEASLEIAGVDVIVKPGQVGRRLNITATLVKLRAQAGSLLDGEILLAVEEDPPAILDLSQQAEIARAILSEPLVLSLPKGQGDSWRFSREDLAGMLTIERVASPEGDTYQVGLDSEQLRSFLTEIAPGLARSAANARFIFNDDTRQLEVIQPAVIGQTLDIEASIDQINQSLLAGEHHVTLDLELTQPAVTDDSSAADLGITELVHAETSYFRGSSAERIQNITTAASRFHGVLVAPGETFSMAEKLGDVSLDTGYAEAWIIYGDRTIKGVGGGVCQVSTTLFRTVFFGGYPVVERYPHAYRVYYYEQTYNGYSDNLAGLDATVFVPYVDFKFTNDTPYWLLMETYVVGTSLTWKFYSTSDGRSVEWETTGLRNVEDPPDPLFQENPALAKGEIKQVDWAVAGADVTVTRTVLRAGNTLYNDSFSTHYIPWRAVCEYGPGTRGMPPQNPSASDPCQPDKR
jgi:vancomycin resistance protein YoaR